MLTSNRYVSIWASNPLAEVLLIDSNFQVIAKGAPPLRVNVPLGLYVAKVKIGDEQSEKVFRVDQGKNDVVVQLTAPKFESPIPLIDTSTSNDDHIAVVERFLLPDNFSVGIGIDANSEIMICIRDPLHSRDKINSDSNVDTYRSSFEGFRLLNHHGEQVVDLGESAEYNLVDGLAVITIRLPAAPYKLVYACEKQSFCFSLPATKGWTLQCYINLVPTARQGRLLSPDLMGMAILYGRMEERFDPFRSDVIATETIRKGMLEGRIHTDERSLLSMLSEKFENPMLGIFALYMLLDEKEPRFKKIKIVLMNTERMLGRDHPDVVAIGLEISRRQNILKSKTDNWSEKLRSLKGPPILTKSWEFLLKFAHDVPADIININPAFEISRHSIGQGVYLNWMEENYSEHEESKIILRQKPDAFSYSKSLMRKFDLLLKTADSGVSHALKLAKEYRHSTSAIDSLFIEMGKIKTCTEAANALTKLALAYDWGVIVPDPRALPKLLYNLTGLKGELILMLRDISDDKSAIEAINEKYIQRLLDTRRIPLASLSEAMADIEMGLWGMSFLPKVQNTLGKDI